MKITVLAYLDKEDGEIADVVVGQVAAALRKGGHRVSVFGVHSDPRKLIAGLIRRAPELVFNLKGTQGESPFGPVPAVGALDLLGLPYTGPSAGESYLQEDKALIRKLLAFDQIAYPAFAVFCRDGKPNANCNLRMPLVVKTLRTDPAHGVGGRSLVFSRTEMTERVQEIHNKTHDAALVEEYVEGRDFCVGVLGNGEPLALPPMAIASGGLADTLPLSETHARWHERGGAARGSGATFAALADATQEELQKIAIDAYRALRIRDYGEIDLRLTETGDVYVTEVNPSCYLEQSGAFAAAAAAHGIDYPTLINRIADLAMERQAHRHSSLRGPVLASL